MHDEVVDHVIQLELFCIFSLDERAAKIQN